MSADLKFCMRDPLIAFSIGFTIEFGIAVALFVTGGSLTVDYPWLRISQLPGTEISLRLFVRSGIFHRYGGMYTVSVVAILIQAFGFALIALGLLYIYRLLRTRQT
jgi:hypothetical protein